MLQKSLQEIGLNPSEAKVYLACLKSGTQDVKTIAKETGLTPAVITLTLASLTDRGLVSKFARKKDFFTAEHPRVVLNILQNKVFRMKESVSKFDKLLPQFEKYMDPSCTRPEVAFYEGKEGVIAACEDTLTAKTDILAIASLDDTEIAFPRYVPTYYKRRKAAGILIRAIFPESKKSRDRQKKDATELRESKLLPKKVLDFHIELNIYDDKVAYFSIPEKLAIIVKSNVIADGMRGMFELCWRMADLYAETKKKPAAKKKTVAKKKTT